MKIDGKYDFENDLRRSLSGVLDEGKDVYYVRVRIGAGKDHRDVAFYSEGDFRPDVVREAEKLREHGGYGLIPGWKDRVSKMSGQRVRFSNISSGFLEIGALDIGRLAQIASTAWADDIKRDGNGLLAPTEEQYMREVRGAVVTTVMAAARIGYPSQMLLPPNGPSLKRWEESARRLFRLYANTNVGTMLVTPGNSTASEIGRKKFGNMRLAENSDVIYDVQRGVRVLSVNPCVHVMGIHSNGDQERELEVNFGLPMHLGFETYALNKGEEKAFVRKTIESFGRFDRAKTNIKSNGQNGKPAKQKAEEFWRPKREELIREVEDFLGIN